MIQATLPATHYSPIIVPSLITTSLSVTPLLCIPTTTAARLGQRQHFHSAEQPVQAIWGANTNTLLLTAPSPQKAIGACQHTSCRTSKPLPLLLLVPPAATAAAAAYSAWWGTWQMRAGVAKICPGSRSARGPRQPNSCKTNTNTAPNSG